MDGNRQVLGNKKLFPIPQLVCVFVFAAELYGNDKFFVLEWSKMQDLLIAHHKRWLDSHDGVRPKKPDSMHCSLGQSELLEYKDNWSLIRNMIKTLPV